LGTTITALSLLPWGRVDRGEAVEQVTVLVQNEAVRLDPDRLGNLYAQLGEAGAEDILGRAMEELAVRLTCGERYFRQGRFDDLRKVARSVAAIADQIGMHMLARVARDVAICIDRLDDNGLAATLARLLRIGERSLTAVWDIRDMSV
jgi:hypothetical protein